MLAGGFGLWVGAGIVATLERPPADLSRTLEFLLLIIAAVALYGAARLAVTGSGAFLAPLFGDPTAASLRLFAGIGAATATVGLLRYGPDLVVVPVTLGAIAVVILLVRGSRPARVVVVPPSVEAPPADPSALVQPMEFTVSDLHDSLAGPGAPDSKRRESVAALFRQEYVLGQFGADATPVVRLCDLLLTDSLITRASAVRVALNAEGHGIVEYEIAGAWRQVMKVPGEATIRMINRLKVMAVLDIAHLPLQEGELHLRYEGAPVVMKIRTETTEGPFERVLIQVPGVP